MDMLMTTQNMLQMETAPRVINQKKTAWLILFLAGSVVFGGKCKIGNVLLLLLLLVLIRAKSQGSGCTATIRLIAHPVFYKFPLSPPDVSTSYAKRENQSKRDGSIMGEKE
jgi:hypothetical protein